MKTSLKNPPKSGLLIGALLLAVSALTGCEKDRLDQQVRELCAKDGGIRVYEQVTLPADKFNQWGEVGFYNPRLEIKGARLELIRCA